MIRDVRYAIRRLVARPGFALTAVLSLALGIGANTAIFTLVNDVLLRKPAFAEPDRLADLYVSTRYGPFDVLSTADLDHVARATTGIFTGVAGTSIFVAWRQDGDQSEQLIAEVVTPNFFPVLGLRAQVGRLFDSVDAPSRGVGSVVVLTDAFWRRAFGRDPGVVGRTIRLTGNPYTVVGVAPADYPASLRGVAVDIFAPTTVYHALDPMSGADEETSSNMFAKVRLQPGVSTEQARVALRSIANDLKANRVRGWSGEDAFVMIPLADVIVWPPLDRFLVPIAGMLMVVVGLVLVIACANLAAFLLARAVDRRKEIAVRLALGATRQRLISQLLVETVLLGLVGGALGVVVGRVVLQLVMQADLPFPLPISFGLTLDWRVLAFSFGVSVAAGLLFGLAPALQATRLDLARVIRDESAGGGRVRNGLRQALVAGQVAVSVVLLVVAGLFARSLDAARSVDPGFGDRPAALAWIGLPGNRGAAANRRALEQIEGDIAAIPGITAVGAADNLHLNALSTNSAIIRIDGVDPPAGQDGHEVDRVDIDAGFVDAFGLELVKGRNFLATDTESAPPVVLVNQAFVDRFWPNGEPLGRRFRMPSDRVVEVVGVVNTAKIRTLAEDPRPAVYQPLSQTPVSVVWVVAQTTGNAEVALASVLRQVRESDPEALFIQSRTLERHLATMSLPMKLGSVALGSFALLALGMASIGLYGTVSYAVAQRTREMGIRLSLGADRGRVVRLMLWGGLRLVFLGVFAGLVVALALARLLDGLLFGIGALDPVAFALAPLVLTVVALVAAFVPALRAGRVSPSAALRLD